MEEQCPNSAVPSSDEVSFTPPVFKTTQDFVAEISHTPILKTVKIFVENSTPDSVQNPFQNPTQSCKWTGACKQTLPVCPSNAELNQSRGGIMQGSRTRPQVENTSNSPPLCTSLLRKVDVRRKCKGAEQASVHCISKPAYRVNDSDKKIGIGSFSRCSQLKVVEEDIDPTFSSNQPDQCHRVEVLVDPQLDQCSKSKQCDPPHSKFTDISTQDSNKVPGRNECDSFKQALCRVGGLGMGVGVVPTVALAVPIMFGVSNMDPRLCVDPRLLAPSAENRRNHRLCSKVGRYPNQFASQYTTQRFSHFHAKLSFVHERKHTCSKRRVAALISLLFLVGCCLALTICFNTKVDGFFDERDDRAENLEDQEVSQSQIANWTPWTEWSGCLPGVTERSRFRQCILGNGPKQTLADISQCMLLSQDESRAGDIEVDNCPNDSTQPPDNDLSGTSSLQATHDYVVGQSMVPTTAATTRHCDECVGDEVCVALARKEVPECRAPLDRSDPTGCAGHCRLGVEMCRQLDRDAFRCLEQQHCFDTEFRCANLLCIPGSKRCDGHNNCYDESDEYDCVCDLQTHFHCHNGTSCLELKKRCDGIIDCWDGSDEVNCTNACPGDEVMCGSGSCIRRAYFCDGLRDCKDGSDEPFGCGEHCHRHEITCVNGRCVSTQTRCNGLDDCGDATDEIGCPVVDSLPTQSTVH